MLDKLSNLLDKQQNSIKDKDDVIVELNEKAIKLQQENQKLRLLVKKYKENLNVKIEQQDKVADLPIPYQRVKHMKTICEQAATQRFTPHVDVKKIKLLNPNLKKSNKLTWMRLSDDMRLNSLANQLRVKNKQIAYLQRNKEIMQEEINNDKKKLNLYEKKYEKKLSGVSLIK